MNKREPDYYALKVTGITNPPANLFYQNEHDEIFVSAAMRLCGFAKMAHIENKKIAEVYKELCLKHFAQKYGGAINIEITEWIEGLKVSKSTLLKIVRDTDKINSRIKESKIAK